MKNYDLKKKKKIILDSACLWTCLSPHSYRNDCIFVHLTQPNRSHNMAWVLLSVCRRPSVTIFVLSNSLLELGHHDKSCKILADLYLSIAVRRYLRVICFRTVLFMLWFCQFLICPLSFESFFTFLWNIKDKICWLVILLELSYSCNFTHVAIVLFCLFMFIKYC